MVALGQRHPYQTSAKIISNFVTSLVGALVYVTDCRMVDVDEFTELWVAFGRRHTYQTSAKNYFQLCH